MKTTRFTLVVKQCGPPEIYLAWVDPARDKFLKRALAENRVMTLHQELHGGKKDFGTVGYLKDRNAQIILFPKSLRRFADRRIIAVDYSLLAQSNSVEKISPKDGETESFKHRTEKAAEKKSEFPEKQRKKETDSVPVRKQSRPEAPLLPDKVAVSSLPVITKEIKLAVNELDAGKAVAAYKRLQRLLARLV